MRQQVAPPSVIPRILHPPCKDTPVILHGVASGCCLSPVDPVVQVPVVPARERGERDNRPRGRPAISHPAVLRVWGVWPYQIRVWIVWPYTPHLNSLSPQPSIAGQVSFSCIAGPLSGQLGTIETVNARLWLSRWMSSKPHKLFPPLQGYLAYEIPLHLIAPEGCGLSELRCAAARAHPAWAHHITGEPHS